MKYHYSKSVLFSLLSFAIIFLFINYCSEHTSLLVHGDGGLKKWAYCLPGTLNRNGTSYLRDLPSQYDVIAITGFKINADASIRKTESLKSTVTSTVPEGTVICYVFTFNSLRSALKILSSAQLTYLAASNLSKFARLHSLPHIHLDIEYLPPSMSDNLGRFLSSIKKQLHNENAGCRLSMAVFPHIDFPARWSGFHNLDVISRYCDEAVIMCYDYHLKETLPGPVTDVKWTVKNIEHMLKYFSPDRLWLGIPAYGYSWSNDGKSTVISARYAVKLYDKGLCRRDVSGNSVCDYTVKGKKYIAYVSDRKTRDMLADIARRYRLKGTALWRLGFEE